MKRKGHLSPPSPRRGWQLWSPELAASPAHTAVIRQSLRGARQEKAGPSSSVEEEGLMSTDLPLDVSVSQTRTVSNLVLTCAAVLR